MGSSPAGPLRHLPLLHAKRPLLPACRQRRGDAQLVALLPQTVGEGRAYLEQLGVFVADVKQISLAKLGLSGTPTLILVDGNGIVTEVWVGALAPSKENEVIHRLATERASE